MTRILLVDDCAAWRSSVRSILERSSALRVVGQAADGIEAVEKATALRPDVVFLDLGMPRLNGIEAARIIRQRACPDCEIVFLTEESDSDIRRAALDTGAIAYVVKAAASELLRRFEEVLRDNWKSLPLFEAVDCDLHHSTQRF